MDDTERKQDMNDRKRRRKITIPLTGNTNRKVLRHLKKRKNNKFRHITKAEMDFQDAMFDYIADLIFYVREAII